MVKLVNVINKTIPAGLCYVIYCIRL